LQWLCVTVLRVPSRVRVVNQVSHLSSQSRYHRRCVLDVCRELMTAMMVAVTMVDDSVTVIMVMIVARGWRCRVRNVKWRRTKMIRPNTGWSTCDFLNRRIHLGRKKEGNMAKASRAILLIIIWLHDFRDIIWPYLALGRLSVFNSSVTHRSCGWSILIVWNESGACDDGDTTRWHRSPLSVDIITPSTLILRMRVNEELFLRCYGCAM